MAKKKTKKRAPKRDQTAKRRTPPKARTMNAQQARFVDHYIVSLNATQAAIEAGYSENSASKLGHDLLKNPLVAEAVQAAKDARSARVAVTADNVLREYTVIGFSNVALYEMDDEGHVRPREGVNPVVMRAVSRVKRRVTTRTTKDGESIRTVDSEFALWPKDAGLRALSDHLGICTTKKDINVKGSLYDLIAGIEKEEADGGDED